MGKAAKKMLVGGMTEEQEAVLTPIQMVFRSFIQDKIAMAGVLCFLLIFLCCVILPFFLPIDMYYQDVTQANVAPGFGMLKVPGSLADNAQQLSIGSTFSVGIDKDGHVYEWGSFPTDKLKKLPSDMGKLTQVSAGLDHIVAINEEGEVFTWGNDRMGLSSIPVEMRMGETPKEVYAGYQFSLALTDRGRLYSWGNSYLVDIKFPEGVQGNIKAFDANNDIVIALTEDGEVVPLTKKETAYSKIPEEIQGHAVDIALSDESVAVVTDDGRVYAWGNNIKGSCNIPEEIQGHVKVIEGGRFHYAVILDDGSVAAWGDNTFGQAHAPSIKEPIKSISAGYYGTYAIGESDKAYSWGLDGYLMGTDDFGRDIFRRLLKGGRMTMTVGAIAVIISTIIGVIVGGVSGYKGGKVDNIMMRLTEIVSSLPFLPFAIILSAIIGNSISETQRIIMIMVILGLLSWPGIARLVRGSVLAEREQEFVTAAKALGVKEWGIIFRHILPNVITVIIVNATLDFATCMLTESSLSFIGFGVTEPNATWGNMLNSARSATVIEKYWWRWVFPSIVLAISTISINCIGDGLRDAIDPKSKER
ncbi:MAG: ABC transporter permease subunit [Lachnospiraceae bacterium]|nr:ABC transporter permease subunit [Lachnospiraceae bacterium]